eukprot:CAMPEP_0170210108 /NCGR_PEP_ID=MMETSP0116_2-20130129/4650_1 /TAXON_ID=400756 /ORGANISM="Durinskia baltica, Strain CSIRO CS-38" /LENGTH=233 /DNA_ID=CAMNT_0010460603 /DNA_START=15 /DNA_END=716 /DNA_ORIENTATION=-
MTLNFIFVLLSSFVHGFVVHQPIMSHPGFYKRETQHRTRALVGAELLVASEAVMEPMTSTTMDSTLKPKIQKLKGEEDFRSFLDEDDRLCIIKFHAPTCKSCQKFGVQYNRIGKEIGDLTAQNQDGSETLVLRTGEIRLAEMEYGANKELCKSLGVTKLPTVHFYSRGKFLEGFPCGPRKIGILLEKISRYRSMTASELEFEVAMNEGSALGDIVLETLDINVSSQKSFPSAI